MNIFKKAKEVGVKSVAKRKVKSVVNDKLGLEGKLDDKLDQLTDKTIDKIGVDNVLKAKKVVEIIKE